jgi:nitronate monooxygenase
MLGSARFEADLAALRRHKVPVVITSVGEPSPVVEVVHEYGGVVLHDVTTVRHARKAAEAGVDGLILVCAGAGGHAGSASPFALLPQVREFFDKTVVLAGAISDGRGIRAAQVLGADYAYMGTRFIATQESKARAPYKDMLVEEETHDVVYTDAFSGMSANYLRASIVKSGMDPANLPKPKGLWQPDLPEGVKAWRDIWSAGQGVGMIKDIPTVAELVERLSADYKAAC